MSRLWITKDNPETSESKTEVKKIYTPKVRIIRSEIIPHISPGLYSYTCLDYNDISHLNALAASGALSLGTSAGTDRSISAEFGGDVPHNLAAEYYSYAGNSSATETLSFSDFHGLSAAPFPVSDCLWTHYDFSECDGASFGESIEHIEEWETTQFAKEQQCMKGYYYKHGGNKICRTVDFEWEESSGDAEAMTRIECGPSCRWGGKSFLVLGSAGSATESESGGWGYKRRTAFGLQSSGNPSWLGGCYGTGSQPRFACDVQCYTRIAVLGGKDTSNYTVTPFYHSVWGGYPNSPADFETGSTTFPFICDDASEHCGDNQLCGLTNPLYNESVHYNAAGPLFGGPGSGNYGFLYAKWLAANYGGPHNGNFSTPSTGLYGCCGSWVEWDSEYSQNHPNSGCHILSCTLYRGPIIIAERKTPDTEEQESWPGQSKMGVGWYTCENEAEIDAVPVDHLYNYNSSSNNDDRYFWSKVLTNNCGFDIWNAPNMFLFNGHCCRNGQMCCMAVGEYFLYNCALTDQELIDTMDYLHLKWQCPGS